MVSRPVEIHIISHATSAHAFYLHDRGPETIAASQHFANVKPCHWTGPHITRKGDLSLTPFEVDESLFLLKRAAW